MTLTDARNQIIGLQFRALLGLPLEVTEDVLNIALARALEDPSTEELWLSLDGDETAFVIARAKRQFVGRLVRSRPAGTARLLRAIPEGWDGD